MFMRNLGTLLVLFVAAHDLIGLPLPSNFDPKRDARLKRLTAGLHVVVVPETTDVFEGEDVWVKVYLTCDSLMIPSLGPWELQDGIILFSGEAEIPAIRGAPIDVGPAYATPVLSFQHEFQLNEAHYSHNTTRRSDFPHLLPGQYGGYFYFGIQSPDFHFRVLSVSKDLAPIWNQYRSLRSLSYESWMPANSPTILDSARALTESFHALPCGSHYRMEGLRGGIKLMSSYVEYFAPDDSLDLVAHVLALADEPRVRDFEVEYVIHLALCRKWRDKHTTIREQDEELHSVLRRLAGTAPTARSRAVFERLATAREEQ